MKSTILLIFFNLFLLSFLHSQEYDIYFPNHDTEMIQLREPGQIDLGIALTTDGGGNFQLGYSPIQHLSLAASYSLLDRQTGATSEFRRKQISYSFAVGTYYYLANKKNKKYKENTRIIDLSKQSGLLLTAQLGYSYNEMENSVFHNSNFRASEFSYSSVFLTMGVAMEYEWGLTTISNSYRRLHYLDGGGFAGNTYNLEKAVPIVNQLRKQANYGIYSVGVHNQFGKMMVKVLAGGTLPIIYFQDFENQAAEIKDGSIYLGILINIEDTISLLRKRR